MPADKLLREDDIAWVSRTQKRFQVSSALDLKIASDRFKGFQAFLIVLLRHLFSGIGEGPFE